MNLLIAVPSKDRADMFEKKTLQVLGSLPFTLFVEPQERKEYDRWNPYVIDDNDRGICYAISQIKDYAQSHGFEYVLKIDDDVGELDVRALIAEAQKLFDKYENVGAVSCTRNDADNYRYMFVDHPLESVFVIRTELLTETRKKGLHHDAAQTLKIWDEGYRIVQTGVNLKNDVGRSNDVKPDGYKRRADRFIPLSSGTQDELDTHICKRY